MLMDAIRVSDGRLVSIKRVATDGDEISTACMLSSEPLCSQPGNHCVPILDHFQDDESAHTSYIVMPFLRSVDDPPLETVNDVVLIADQLLEVCKTLPILFVATYQAGHRAWSPCTLMALPIGW